MDLDPNTTQPLIQLMNKIYQGLDSETPEYTLGVFIDLKKAFDTCNIHILLSKLNHYGFKGISNKWFNSYLNNLTQYVEINGIKSSVKKLLMESHRVMFLVLFCFCCI